MFISELDFFSNQQSGSFSKRPSPSARKCRFNETEGRNKEQLYKNTAGWRRGWAEGAAGAVL